MVYGDYLRSLMQQNLQSPSEYVPVQTAFADSDAVDVEPDGEGAKIHLSDGNTVSADRVVLAMGNERPAEFPGCAEMRDHPAWVGNPWQAWDNRLPGSEGTVILLGTGLTTVDAVITLRTLGWQGLVHAVSRNGWLPQSHFRGIDYPDFPPKGVNLATLSLKDLVPLIEGHCARLRELGANPAIVVDKLRPQTQRIWQALKLEDRQEFVRHYAARWSVLRHRIPPEIHAQVTTAQLTGQLQVHAAAIERVEAQGNQVRVHLSNGKTLNGDLVINATGPQTRFSDTSSVLLRNLLRRGLVTPDDMDMGVRAKPDHTIIDGGGKRSHFMLALGPLLRGSLWETTAVPELRDQARRVAETILNHPVLSETMPPMAVIEYMI
jgi:uncharacterized NAD(P)/FAD-binding protein YdhS